MFLFYFIFKESYEFLLGSRVHKLETRRTRRGDLSYLCKFESYTNIHVSSLNNLLNYSFHFLCLFSSSHGVIDRTVYHPQLYFF